MKRGTAIDRAFMCVLQDGLVVVDWGDGRMQDVRSGEFRPKVDDRLARTITDDELQSLVQQGIATGYDAKYVYLLPLPEAERNTLE